MTYEELSNNYAKIGRNRRIDEDDSERVMGRKGIGKLAALYLSRRYYISSKTLQTSNEIYKMDFSKEKEDINTESPELVRIDEKNFDNSEFDSFSSGTMIRMEDVNLKGYASVSLETLNNVLADFFSVDNLNNQKIYLKIVTSKSDLNKDFSVVEKVVPFKNMVKILCFDDKTFGLLDKKYSENTYRLPYKDGTQKEYKTDVKLKKVNGEEFETVDGVKKVSKLTGWLGIHSSISQDVAQKNDSNFRKNKLYNPMKLRIYVRNKLAIDNFLPVINNNQVFSNFIEGEIGFDILDDNDFPDIATTSRQNMDESDERIIYLANTLRGIATDLISARNKIANNMKRENDQRDENANNKAKEQLSDDIKDEIDKSINEGKMKEDDRQELENIREQILRNIKGETIKKKRMIFFSHSRENKKILDFYFHLLKSRGIDKKEMFYTSQTSNTEVKQKQNLGDISKKNIVDTNTVLFFYSTEDFRKSEYCMFEGGAAWATRTKKDIFVSFDKYENVPDYLNNDNEFQHCLREDTDILSGDEYNKLVQSLNFLIDHINEGRKIQGREEVNRFEEVDFPDKVQQEEGIVVSLDESIFRYWDAYVKKGVLKQAQSKGYVTK